LVFSIQLPETAEHDKGSHPIVELGAPYEVFKVQRHAPRPVLVIHGARDVDPVRARVWRPQLLVHVEDVLDLEHAQEGARPEALRKDALLQVESQAGRTGPGDSQ